jgi:hypothetical protein
MTTVRTPSLTLVTAKPGILTINRLTNLDNVRAFVHQLTPVIVTVLTTLSITTEDKAALWVSLIFAVLDPLLSYSRATDKARQIAYALGGLLQSGGLLTAILMVAPPTAVPIVSAVITVITSTLSRFYTPTSTMLPKTMGTTSASPTFPGNPWPV